MTEEERKAALIKKITKSLYLVDLVQLLEEELEYRKSSKNAATPTPEENKIHETRLQKIAETLELSDFKKLWQESDHKQLAWLQRENLLTETEKLLLHVQELRLYI